MRADQGLAGGGVAGGLNSAVEGDHEVQSSRVSLGRGVRKAARELDRAQHEHAALSSAAPHTLEVVAVGGHVA